MSGSMEKWLLCWLVVASLCSVGNASPAEGATLMKMLSQWTNVSFPSWKAGSDPCSPSLWENVTCDANGFVVGLNVSNRNIVGSIPPEIGDLVHLQELDMGNIGGTRGKTIPNKNFLTAAVPDSLARLTSLRVLNLSSLRNMGFPLVLTKITSLQEFNLGEANLTGSVPQELYSMPNLRTLFLGGNLFSDIGLKDFQTLTTLQELSLWGNNINQTLPPELAKLTGLTYLTLHDCNLFGPLPDWIGNFTKINRLELYNNDLTGRIPDSVKVLQNMSTFRMEGNNFFQLFPIWLMTEMPNLSFLSLSKSDFYGTMPSAGVFNAMNGTDVRLDCNYFTGSDPFPSEQSTYKFRTKVNCYDGDSPTDLAKILTSCDKPVGCSDFQAIVNSNRCPRCPKTQNVLKRNPPNNPCVCVYGGGNKAKAGVSVGAVIGGALGLFVVFLIVVGFILWKKREKFAIMDRFKVKKEEDLGDWEIPAGVERFTLLDLAKITDNFSDGHVIGAGGFGKVFRGSLGDGREVAIKRASASSMQGTGEFRNEITLLSRLHHRHLVRLEGFCEEDDLQILVYEYMVGGNLHSHLLGKITNTPLQWYKRLEIAVGVAQGLEYLHSFADPPVIHRDVKPSNILLDENMVAKLSDFGISKATADLDTHVSTRPAGTAGYLDPEYFLRRQLTTASDVYSFGVVLLELVTGQEAIDHKRHEEYNLIEWAKKRFKSRGITSIIDPLLEYEYSREAYTAMTKLALLCASFNKDERPNMKMVLTGLEPHLAIQSLYGPKNVSELPGGEDAADPDDQTRTADANTKVSRPVYITFESEYMDTSIPTEVGSNLKIVTDNLRPR